DSGLALIASGTSIKVSRITILLESVRNRTATPAVERARMADLSGILSRHALGIRTGCNPSVFTSQSVTLSHRKRLSSGLSHFRLSGAGRCAYVGRARLRTLNTSGSTKERAF